MNSINQPSFLERFYTLDEQDSVCIKIFQPYLDNTDYRTDFTITRLDKPIQSHTYGVDSFQSIYLAMYKIGVMLYNSPEYKQGCLKYLNSNDLQLPITTNFWKYQ